jgi:hypothetical protein
LESTDWRKTKGDWDAWNARSLTDEPVIRLILDATVARVRLDRKATRSLNPGPQPSNWWKSLPKGRF